MKTLPVVVLCLADPRRAALLASQLEASGYQGTVADGSDELYQILNRDRVDLLIVEQRLQGFLSGLEILERLYADLLRPATILLAEETREVERRAKKMGLSQILPPTTPWDQTLAAVKTVLARTAVTQLRIPPAAHRLVRDADCIRPLPQLLVKLCGALRDEAVTPEDLARDIAVDARVTAELLRLANSSALGRAHKTTNLPDAVTFLGVKRTISLVLSMGLMRAQSGLLGGLAGTTRSWYNHRSVLIGSTAFAFAGNLEIVSPETAYILGLLQDVGVLVLAQAHGEHYAGLLERARDIPVLRLDYMEKEDFGASHAEVSAALLQKWGLPESLVSMVVGHHAEPREGASEVEAAFLRVMRVGEAVADLADRPAPRRFLALNRLLSHYGVERAVQCRASLDEGVARALESSRLFNMPLPDDEALARVLRDIDAQARHDAAALPEDSKPPPEPAPTPVDIPKMEMEAETEPDDAGGAERRPRRVLVIDDEAQIAQIIRLFVASLDIEVLACSGWADAEQLAPRADLILCDVHLGKENGIDLVRRLRSRGYRGPVLMVSGDRNRATVQESIESGVSGYLIKPFSKSLLLDKLRRHLALEEAEAVAPTRA